MKSLIVKILSLSILCPWVAIFGQDMVSNKLYATDAMSIDSAKQLLALQITSLSEKSSDKILLSNEALDAILQSFSGSGFTFEELAYEFLVLSKDLNKPIALGDSSMIFNKYKKSKGLGLKYARFAYIEYNGREDYILMRFLPNTEDGQSYVEMLDDRDIYYKRDSLLTVSKIYNRGIKVRKGLFSVDNAYVNTGISFKPRDGDERVDTNSILGILPRTEFILVIEGVTNGKRLTKGALITIIDNKYGTVYDKGDYIK